MIRNVKLFIPTISSVYSNNVRSYHLDRFKGKVAIVTASTDGLVNKKALSIFFYLLPCLLSISVIQFKIVKNKGKQILHFSNIRT